MKTLTIKEPIATEPQPIPASAATLLPLWRRRELAKPAAVTLPLPFHARAVVAQPLHPLPPKQTYAVDHATGSFSRIFGADLVRGERIEIELPLGSPRYVSAATLKRLLGAERTDRLLKRTGDIWKFCEDGVMVDLRDTTTEYRVGPVSIFS